MPAPSRPRRRRLPGLVAVAVALTTAACAMPQRNDVYRLPAPYNFEFYDTHEDAARSFYAAHYAHFGAYELLTPDPAAGVR